MKSAYTPTDKDCSIHWTLLLVLALLCSAGVRPAVGQICTFEDLGTLPGGTSSNANDINERGEIAAAFSLPSGQFHAYFLERERRVDLGTFPGGSSSAAR